MAHEAVRFVNLALLGGGAAVIHLFANLNGGLNP